MSTVLDDDLIDRCRDEAGHIDKALLHLRGALSDNNLFGGDEVNPEPLGGAPLVEARGFRARGRLGEEVYEVGVFWGGELGDDMAIRGWPDSRARVADWIGRHEDEYVEILAPGFGSTIGLGSPLAVYAALVAPGAEMSDFNGDLPPDWPHEDPDGPALVH